MRERPECEMVDLGTSVDDVEERSGKQETVRLCACVFKYQYDQ